MTLEGHWPLTEDGGSTAYDYSGNENHGSITGAGPAGTGTVTGPFGNSAYGFDGDDYVDVSGVDSFLKDAPLTVSSWVNKNNTDSAQKIFDHGENRVYVAYEGNAANGYEFGVYNGSSHDVVSSNNNTTGKWMHIAGVIDSTDIILYINGTKVSSTNFSSIDESKQTTSIGFQSTETPEYFEGSICELRLYSRALTPQEIQALYQAGRKSEAVFR